MAASGRCNQPPAPPEPPLPSSQGLSCRSAAQCTAVGSAVTSGVVVTLAEQWNGKRLGGPVHTQPFGETLGNDLLAVSCPLVTACTAVGYSLNSSAAQVPAGRTVERHKPGQSSPCPARRGAGLVDVSAVSCRSAGGVPPLSASISTARHTPLPLAERWNGTSWGNPDPAEPLREHSRRSPGSVVPDHQRMHRRWRVHQPPRPSR